MAQIIGCKILIVDPNPLSFFGISNYLTQSGHLVVGQAVNLDQSIQNLDQTHLDLVLVGPGLEEDQALAICREVSCRRPDIKTIIITPHAGDELFQVDAGHAGAAACLPHVICQQDLCASITAVRSGRRLYTDGILLQAYTPIALTRRQCEILSYLAAGKTDPEIAHILGLSVRTIRNHSQQILERLGVHSRQDAVRRARRRGWI